MDCEEAVCLPQAEFKGQGTAYPYSLSAAQNVSLRIVADPP